MRPGVAAVVFALTLGCVACPGGTQLEVRVRYDGLDPVPDTYRVQLVAEDGTRRGPVPLPTSPREVASDEAFVLLLPDELAGVTTWVFIDAEARGVHVASGQASATPVLGSMVPVAVDLGVPLRCGDGQVRPPLEACDDANDVDGDGCNSACQIDSNPSDGGPENGNDAGMDGGPDDDGGLAIDAGVDAGPGVDGGVDAGPDAGAGLPDGGLVDAGELDAGVPLAPLGWVAHWPLDVAGEDEGGNYPGTVVGSAVGLAGPVGQGLLFPEAADHVDFGPIAELGGADQLSISLWFFTQDDDDGRTLFTVDGPGEERMRIETDSSATILELSARDGEVADAEAAGYASFALDGQWHHLVFLFDGSQPPVDRLRLVVDGVEEPVAGDALTAAALPSSLGTADFMLARDTSGSWRGGVDDVYLYDRVLSLAEIAALFARGDPPDTPMPRTNFHLPFEGSATEIVDGQAGVLGGNPTFVAGVGGGQAISLDGVGDLVHFSQISELQAESDYSIGFWLRDRSLQDPHVILDVPGQDEPIRLGTNRDGDLEYTLGAVSRVIDNSAQMLERGHWHHIAIVHDTGDTFRPFIDGQEQSFTSIGVLPDETGAAYDFYVGGADHPFAGELDDLRIGTRDWETPEIRTLVIQSGPALAGFPQEALDHHHPLELDLIDAVGGLNGSLQSGFFVDGVQGFGFPGLEGGAATFGMPAALNSSSGFAIALWFRSDANENLSDLLGAFEGGSSYVGLGLGEDIVFDITDGTTAQVSVADWATQHAPGQPHQVVAVFDGTRPEAERVELYIDGTTQPLVSNAIPFPAATAEMTGGTFFIGDEGSPVVPGPLDEIRIFDRPLVPSEVMAVFEEDRPRIPADWLAHFGFAVDGADTGGIYDANALGTVAFSDGPQGQAATFTPDGVMQVGTIPALGSGTALSLSFWLRLDDVTLATDEIIFDGFALQTDDLRLEKTSTGALKFDASNAGADQAVVWTGFDGAMADQGWHHFVVVYDGTEDVGNRAWLFVDGMRTDFDQGVGLGPSFSNSGLMYSIGGRAQTGMLRGSLDELYIYQRRLRDPEAQALFAHGEP